jgi:hypothetical protein
MYTAKIGGAKNPTYALKKNLVRRKQFRVPNLGVRFVEICRLLLNSAYLKLSCCELNSQLHGLGRQHLPAKSRADREMGLSGLTMFILTLHCAA